MSVEQNKALVSRHFTQLYDKGELSVTDEIYAEDYLNHNPPTPRAPSGPQSEKDPVIMLRKTFPDLHIVMDDIVAEGEKVTVRWTITGTDKGRWMGKPPTNKQVAVTGIKTLRVVEGKIVEGWQNVDMLGMLQQLGVVPAPAAST